jgi:hypothetical protein
MDVPTSSSVYLMYGSIDRSGRASEWALTVGEVHAHGTDSEMIVGLLAQARVLQYIQPVLLEGLHAACRTGWPCFDFIRLDLGGAAAAVLGLGRC